MHVRELPGAVREVVARLPEATEGQIEVTLLRPVVNYVLGYLCVLNCRSLIFISLNETVLVSPITRRRL